MYITLEVSSLISHPLLIYRDNPFDKIDGDTISGRELKSGYVDFDNRWHLVSTNSTSTRQLLDSIKTRNAIDRLMGTGCSLVKIEKNRLIAEWNTLTESSAFGMLKADIIEAALRQMVDIGHILEARSGSKTYDDVQAGTNRSVVFVAIVLPFIILVCSAICYLYAESYYYPLSRQSIIRGAIPYSLALVVFQLVISINLLRSIAAPRYMLLALIIMSCIAYPLGGASLTAVINGAKDHSSGIWHSVKVTGKRELRHKEFTLQHYRLKVVLPENGKEIDVPVSANLFRSLQAQRDNIRVLIKPGYLGYPWLAGIKKTVTPTRSGYSLRSAWDLQQAGQKSEALQQFSSYISTHSGNAKGYYYRGRLYAEMKRYSDSLADMRRAIKLDPRYFDAYRFIDWLLARDGRWDEIVDYWSQFIRLEPDNARAYYERGGTYWHKKDMVRSRKDIEKSCQLGYSDACKRFKHLN